MIPEYHLRHIRREDEKLIYSSWLKGSYEFSPNNFIPRELFLEHQSRLIQHCLNTFSTLILCHPDDPDEIFGYICYSLVGKLLIVHWLYLKNMWRKINTGESMVPYLLDELHPTWRDEPIIVTQFSKHFKKHKDKYNLVFNPYYLEGKIA